MPCDSRISIDLNETKFDRTTLEAALKAAGFEVWTFQATGTVEFSGSDGLRGTYQNGKLSLSAYAGRNLDKQADAIRKAYSTQVVRDQAAKMGWTVTVQPDGKLEVKAGGTNTGTSRGAAPKKGW